MIEQFDAIIIGAGQAGPALAVRCGKEGLRTAIIERNRFGGTCVNNGCVPTKTLVASARVAHTARPAADSGVVLDAPVRIDMQRVKACKDAIVEQSRKGMRAWLDGAPNFSVIEGHVAFSAAHQAAVGGRVLEAPRIFINTGGRESRPDLPCIDRVPTLNNERIMHLDQVPAHLIIIGGSYIGLEFAQIYRRFGACVTVIETCARIIGRKDHDVFEAIRLILKGEGIEFRLNAGGLGLERRTFGVAVTLKGSDGAATTPTACLASMPWATAMVAGPSRTPAGTITRSLPPTCSTAQHARSTSASAPMPFLSLRHGAAWA